MNLDQFQAATENVIAGIRKVIIGQDDAIRYSLVVVLVQSARAHRRRARPRQDAAGAHAGRVLGCEFNRIQFTPDLMPADITGTNVFNLQRNEFTLVKGPVFTTFLLADEINRAPAKTQSALLEAMQERTVTIDRETHRAVAQLHRLRHPEPHRIRRHLSAARSAEGPLHAQDPDDLAAERRGAVAGPPQSQRDRARSRAAARRGDANASAKRNWRACATRMGLILVSDQLVDYAVQVVRRTRSDDGVLVGAGPRASQALLRAARAWAALSGRDFVSPDDIRAVAAPVLEHRLLLRPESELEGVRISEVLDRILHEVPVPR